VEGSPTLFWSMQFRLLIKVLDRSIRLFFSEEPSVNLNGICCLDRMSCTLFWVGDGDLVSFVGYSRKAKESTLGTLSMSKM
jgi:hypothetical protein